MKTNYTTVPVTTIRMNYELHGFLMQQGVAEQFFQFFGRQVEFVFEELEQRKFYKHFKPTCDAPVISLAKHIPSDYNLDLSRAYTVDGKFIGFFSSGTGLTLEEAVRNLQIKEKQVIIFDEDIGGGYLISLLQKELKETYGIESRVETFLRFDPHKEDILDLKDFIYKYSDTSGLVVKTEHGFERVPYMLSSDLFCKFTPFTFKYAWEVQEFFWKLSLAYHRHITFNKTYEADCCRFLGIPYENATSLCR